MKSLNLFKYYSPKYTDDKGETHDNLSFYTERAIFFQTPNKFNDPWDCMVPHIKFHRQEKAQREVFEQMCKRVPREIQLAEWKKLRKLPRPERNKRFSDIYSTICKSIQKSLV